MNNIVRAWKDAAYRQSLSAQEQAMLPANPAGEIELTDVELEVAFGATGEKGEDVDVNKIDQVDAAAPTFSHDNDLVDVLGHVNVNANVPILSPNSTFSQCDVVNPQKATSTNY